MKKRHQAPVEQSKYAFPHSVSFVLSSALENCRYSLSGRTQDDSYSRLPISTAVRRFCLLSFSKRQWYGSTYENERWRPRTSTHCESGPVQKLLRIPWVCVSVRIENTVSRRECPLNSVCETVASMIPL